MPETGEYWYDALGGWEVARIVAVNGDICAFLVVNSILRSPTSAGDGRIVEMDLAEFLRGYQEVPEIAFPWFGAGSTWFDRRDANSRVIVHGHDVRAETVAFRALREGGAGRLEVSPRRAFSERYVRVPDNADDGLTNDRYWVMGAGICAVFGARADAQSFIYEVSALLNQPERMLEIHRFEHPVGPRWQDAPAP